jgi:chromate transporter
MQTVQQDRTPGIWQLFRVWAGIGLQSFGGGASTIFLIQHEFVEKHSWLTKEEFTHLWNLCIFTPGINLVALTILIGRKLGGRTGIISSLVGMLLPSAAITCLLTAGFQEVEQVSAVPAIIKGVVPATGGIMLTVALRFAQPQLKIGLQRGGLPIVCISIFFILICFVAIALLNFSVVLVLPCAGLLGSILFTRRHKNEQKEVEQHD